MDGDAPGYRPDRCSMGYGGYDVREHPGKICRSGIRRIQPVIAAIKPGCARASSSRCYRRSPTISRNAATWISRNAPSTPLWWRKKKGDQHGKDKGGKRDEA